MTDQPGIHTVRVLTDQQEHVLRLERGANLRRALLVAGLSPYAALTRRANCGVWIELGEPPPGHWHDRLGAAFGYPRLSCQITVTADLTVRLLDDKWIWGRAERARRWRR